MFRLFDQTSWGQLALILGALTMNGTTLSAIAEESVAAEFSWAVASSPEANFVFTSANSLLCPVGRELYRIELGEKPSRHIVYTHPEQIRSVAASPNGKQVAVVSRSGLYELTLDADELKLRDKLGVNETVLATAIDNNGQLVVCLRSSHDTVLKRDKAGDKLRKFYSLAGSDLLTLDPRIVLKPECANINLKKQQIAIAYAGGAVLVSLNTGKPLANASIDGNSAEAVEIEPGSGRLLIARDGQLLIYDSASKLERAVRLGNSSLPAMSIVPSLGTVAILRNEGNARPSTCVLIRLKDGQLGSSLLLSSNAGGAWVATSSDGTFVAALTGYGNTTKLKVWRTAGAVAK